MSATSGEHLALPDLHDHADALIAIIEQERGNLVPILQAVQRRFGWLPQNVLELVAARAGIPLARIWSVATFYASLHLQPRGRSIVRVCHGTACHVRGAQRVTDAAARHLGVDGPGDTTTDLRYTLETVACLGCCSLAPVVAIDRDIHGNLDQLRVVGLLTRGGPEEP